MSESVADDVEAADVALEILLKYHFSNTSRERLVKLADRANYWPQLVSLGHSVLGSQGKVDAATALAAEALADAIDLDALPGADVEGNA